MYSSLSDLVTLGARGVAETGDDAAAAEFTLGAHRSVPPAETLARIEPEKARYGITRVARVTGLDRIGIEVFMVVRPNQYGLAVTQGKGVTREAARVSGLMEAMEFWHAERPDLPLRHATARDLARHYRMPPMAALPLVGAPPSDTVPLFWAMATDLFTGDTVPVPYDLVHACFLEDDRAAESPFQISTNGLASGNSMLEAATHAASELVERDQIIRFDRREAASREAARIDLASVDTPYLAELIGRVAAAEMSVALWDMTNAWGVPGYICQIVDTTAHPGPPGMGAGCHPRRDVAAARAITEAAQSRLTRISGARDDLTGRLFGGAIQTRTLWLNQRAGEAAEATPQAFASGVDLSASGLEAEYLAVLGALRAAGLEMLLAVDLAPDAPFSVVRLIAPGVLGMLSGAVAGANG